MKSAEEVMPSSEEISQWIDSTRSLRAQGLVDMPSLVGRFNVVNIKLDKCGGLWGV